jgi:hypothetical protein
MWRFAYKQYQVPVPVVYVVYQIFGCRPQVEANPYRYDNNWQRVRGSHAGKILYNLVRFLHKSKNPLPKAAGSKIEISHRLPIRQSLKKAIFLSQ